MGPSQGNQHQTAVVRSFVVTNAPADSVQRLVLAESRSSFSCNGASCTFCVHLDVVRESASYKGNSCSYSRCWLRFLLVRSASSMDCSYFLAQKICLDSNATAFKSLVKKSWDNVLRDGARRDQHLRNRCASKWLKASSDPRCCFGHSTTK